MDQDSSHSIQTGTGPVFLGFDCPDRGHRVQGGPAGRRTPSHVIGSADPGPGSHSPGSGAYEEDGTEQLIGNIQPPVS